jgi:hypothetical protein
MNRGIFAPRLPTTPIAIFLFFNERILNKDDMTKNNIDSPDFISDRKLIEELETATKDLLWFSESEYPFKVFYWRNADFSIDSLLHRYNYSPETKIVVKNCQSFFADAIREEDWYDETEIVETKRYQNLVNLMRQKLKNIQVYLLGEVEIDVYILGETDEAIAGLSTKIVAT